MKKIAVFLFFVFMTAASSSYAVPSDYDSEFATTMNGEPGYFKNMARDWRRGFTNLISFPLEIPVTVKKYHSEDPGRPVIRHFAGLTDGIVRSVARGCSGAWDILVSFVPGDQNGSPVDPPTLFG